MTDVKDEIRPAVLNQVKGKKIIETLSTQKGTLDEMAKAFGSDAIVASSSDLKLNEIRYQALDLIRWPLEKFSR